MSERQQRSDGFGIARPAGPDERRRPLRGLPRSRYDVLLLSIPLLLTLAWVVGQVVDAPAWAALAAGALFALPLLADGLAVNPPG